MEHVGLLEVLFLHLEGPSSPMHIGAVCTFEGPPPDFAEFTAHIESRLPLVPRYRQKVLFVPGDLARPVWVDDPAFRIDYHVRQAALPRPGSDAQLREFVGRVMSEQLDQQRPLWEMWVIEGFPNDGWAVLSKVHHCMVDGIAGSDLLTVLFELSPESAPLSQPPAWNAPREPSSFELLTDALRDLVEEPKHQYEALKALGHGEHPVRHAFSQLGDGLDRAVELRHFGHANVLNGPLGSHRRWDFARVSLADVKAAAKRHGATVNDVVLAALTQGFRELLLAHGESLDSDHVVHSLVPVSLRGPDERHQLNNKVAAMIASLPTGIADPQERLRRVIALMRELKESKETEAAHVLTRLSGFVPPSVVAFVVQHAAHYVQSRVNTVTTNVPGPQFPLYVRGRKMLSVTPYIPLALGVRLSVGIFSYDGKIDFGVTGDWDSMTHLDVLCRGVERSLEELCR